MTEADAGGVLTIDHFQPSTQGGSDAPDNLLYCCPRCNQYKANYWPAAPADPPLWNPRHAPASVHFIELENQRRLLEAQRDLIRRLLTGE